MKNKIQEIIENTAAIITIYNPNITSFSKNLDAIKSEFRTIIIVDNSDNNYCIYNMLDLSSITKIHYIKNNKNLGIAEAQNIGLVYSKKLSINYICEFDQDTYIKKGFLKGVIENFLNIKENIDENIIAISALASHSSRKNPIKVLYTLSSGFFYPLSAIDTVGYKETELFIDLVDWLWCMKANSQGKSIYLIYDLVLNHNLGEGQLLIFGVPKPFRHYYAFRNYIHAAKKNYVPLSWKIKYFIINFSKLIIYPFIMKDGFIRLKFMLKGIADGMTHKMGKLNE